MPRRPRVEAPGAIHHVTARGNEGRAIVLDEVDRSNFEARLVGTIELHGWLCWAYCLLDNHFHLIVETPAPNLGTGMQWLKSRYAQDFNYRHQRRGHLFGGRFYSVVIERDAHLLEACIYVVLNPVRAGIVHHPRDWRWSSYGEAAGIAKAPSTIPPNALLELFDKQIEIARSRFVAAVDLALERDRDHRKSAGSDP